MKKWEIWCEGFAVTGNSSQAMLLAIHEAETFDGAVKRMEEDQILEHGNSNIEWNRFGEGKHAIWGCQLFDNETDARKSFG